MYKCLSLLACLTLAACSQAPDPKTQSTAKDKHKDQPTQTPLHYWGTARTNSFQPDAPSAANDVSFIRGTARVISINRPLGQAVLEIDGRHVNAFWQTQIIHARVLDPNVPAFSQPLDPIPRDQEFAANPGDTIGFVGMLTNNDLLLRAIQVVAH